MHHIAQQNFYPINKLLNVSQKKINLYLTLQPLNFLFNSYFPFIYLKILMDIYEVMYVKDN